MSFLIDLFGGDGLIPHGFCLIWSPVLLWLNILSDALIVLAYYSIPLILWYFVHKRKDLPYPRLFLMFGVFIVACGTTHLLSVVTIWIPLYWLDGIVKAFTAIVSVTAALMMIWIIPRALVLRNPAPLNAEIQEKSKHLSLNAAECDLMTEKLRVSEERLRIALDSGQVGIWDLDLQSNELIWDDNMFALYGARREDFSGAYDAWSTRLHPEDKAATEAALQDAINGIREYEPEFRVVLADREVRFIKGHARVIRDQAGNPMRVIGTNWDNSAHALTQKQLKLAHSAINKSQSAFLLVNNKGQVVDLNECSCQSLGYSREELIGQYVWFFDPGFSAELWPTYWAEQKKKLTLTFETHHQHKDRSIFPVEVTANYIVVDGEEYGFSFSQDITERKKVEADLRIATTAFESQEGMLVTDANQVILRVNSAFTKITGYTAEDVLGKNPRIFQSDRQDAIFYAAMWKSINETGSWEGELWNRRKNGENFPEHLIITAVQNQDGIVTNYVASLFDITLSKAAANEIERLAFFDPLTGLPNRRLLLDRLKPALASSHRSGRKGALLFIDMDNFKTLNDTLGHDIGDLLLQQVAERLTSCVREVDTVARLGGDEFVVMLEDLDEQTNEAAAQTEVVGGKILATLNKSYLLATHSYHSTPSIGVALFNGSEQSLDELMKQADIAMYHAKASGRNTLRFFNLQMQASIIARVTLEKDLRLALAENQFELYYQVQTACNNKFIGAEALIRWHHPQRGFISPIDFIPLAEESDLILLIGQWVLETACAQIKRWEGSEHTQYLQLAVNVSARQFRQIDFV